MASLPTQDEILSDMLSRVPSGLSKSEGSFIYAALAPAAFELEKTLIEAQAILDNSYAKDADYEHLIRRAEERAITPKDATAAIVKAKFNLDPPIGSRFSCGVYNYKVTEIVSSDDHTALMACEITGSGPNSTIGAVFPIDYVEGFEFGEIIEIVTPGEDYETQEHLYQRYIDSFSDEAFAGNIAAYKQYCNAIPGVGGCKVYPAWDGGGTVKVVLVSSDYGKVSDTLISDVSEMLSPTPVQGDGIAPIGHKVTVVSAQETSVAITSDVTYKTGYSAASCSAQILAAIEDYLKSLRKIWGSQSYATTQRVYVSRIEALILGVDGVEDASGTTVNGSQTNLTIDWDHIPVMGTVTLS